jgi:hypothetical protein
MSASFGAAICMSVPPPGSRLFQDRECRAGRLAHPKSFTLPFVCAVDRRESLMRCSVVCAC